ncbi:MAG: hypothetical protein IIB00_08045 [candidate division Zixibacteria bacterium]|nr:hypothetical protein [candidate division Zixibacteria bacterium]
MRLTAFRDDGKSVVTAFNIYIDETLKDGWPIKIPVTENNPDSDYRDGELKPVVEDIDNDGLGDSCYVPSYLSPLVVTVREEFPVGDLSGPAFFAVGPPINIFITDPDGLVIGADSLGNITNTIGSGASYSSLTENDSIHIDSIKNGNYLIEIIPIVGADPNKIYTAAIRVDGTVENRTPVQGVPAEGTRDTLNSETPVNILGDADGSGDVNIGDASFLVRFIFQDGDFPIPLFAGDANCSGGGSVADVNIGDASFLVRFIFQGGDGPGCPPIPQQGPAPLKMQFEPVESQPAAPAPKVAGGRMKS